ncbi:MAG: glutamine--fructose-6-phosphate transaminase (isomerizing) [Desulfovibrio sp.]|nr:glutamine--fructose-6-phosphate transaminase (isomerizing) [Desulfovibrio sp.]
MCGIIGYIGHRPALPVVIEGLRRLEYRGYDSAGVAWMTPGKINIARASGKLRALEEKLTAMPAITSMCAMGHTRWATHGEPVERNAHPHRSNDSTLAIVHNGIIENYRELKKYLLERGHEFYSETDTEVLVNLIAERRKTEPDLLSAFAAALSEAKGAYAVCLMSSEAPDVIYAARMSAPLIVGLGSGENFIASDIPAFLPYTREAMFIEDGEIVRATASSLEVMGLRDLKPVQKERHAIQWNLQDAQKDGYKHFMIKEIFEQPRVIRDAMTGRAEEADGDVRIPELENAPIPAKIRIVACGTSYHAGLWGKALIENFANIPVEAEIASEFRYKEKFLREPGEFALLISQSGETADTLAALRIMKEMGVPTVGLCNVVGSSIAREADYTIFTQAGPEISVASTKAMTSQMICLALLALYWGERKGTLERSAIRKALNTLFSLPAALDDNLPEMRKKAKELAKKYANFHNFFYLGRGVGFPLALEGALKLKELSYIHAEGYASGEMKHGPIALIDPEFPTFAIALDDNLLEKVKSNIEEAISRGGKVIALANQATIAKATDTWIIPRIDGAFSAFMALPALQLFSYEVADYLGKDVDQPRNLAKSVTVE